MENVDKPRAHTRLPELLAPAGSIKHLKAAILAGADAVYIGGRSFSARAYADNLSCDEVKDALHYTHLHGRRLYLTVNTLMKDVELNHELYGFLRPYYEAGLDGVIVQDLGTASFIHRNFPDLEVHASTQMTITHAQGAIAAGKLGMTRVVPARELSLDELITIKRQSGLEVEVFIHGALCYCYSGQCLLSSHYGGRSGNRGACAQPCRLPYRIGQDLPVGQLPPRIGDDCPPGQLLPRIGEDRLPGHLPLRSGEDRPVDHLPPRSGQNRPDDSVQSAPSRVSTSTTASFLSMRDLCSLQAIPRLVDAGIDSLKIEGRMKNVDYVAGVTAIYRKYLDYYDKLRRSSKPEDYKVSARDMYDLEELYCRGGFTEGYLDRHNGPSMMAIHTQKNVGRKIGQIQSVERKRRRIKIRLFDMLHPGDILVIPGHGNEETVLTVPQGISSQKSITLNTPKGASLRQGMPVYRRRNEALSTRIKEEILDHPIKYPVEVRVNIRKETPAELTLTSRGVKVTIEGPLACPARSLALGKEDIEKQLKKTGDTPFILAGLMINLEEDCFMPLSAIKKLRQEGYRKLEEEISCQRDRKSKEEISCQRDRKSEEEISCQGDRKSKEEISCQGDRKYEEKKPDPDRMKWEMIAVVYDKDNLSVCLASDFYSAICLPADSLTKEQLSAFHQAILDAGKKPLLSLPGIMRKGKDDFFAFCEDFFWDGIYVHNINEAAWLAGLAGFRGKRIAHASFYQWNRESLACSAREFGMDAYQLPVELGPADLKELTATGMEAELVAYGYQTLMISAQCIKKTTGRCDHQSETLSIIDPKGRRLPVTTHCHYCYNRIWSHEPVDRTRYIQKELLQDVPRLTFDYFRTEPSLVRKLTKRFAGLKQ